MAIAIIETAPACLPPRYNTKLSTTVSRKIVVAITHIPMAGWLFVCCCVSVSVCVSLFFFLSLSVRRASSSPSFFIANYQYMVSLSLFLFLFLFLPLFLLSTLLRFSHRHHSLHSLPFQVIFASLLGSFHAMFVCLFGSLSLSVNLSSSLSISPPSLVIARSPSAFATDGGFVTRSAPTHSSIRRFRPW